VIDKPLTLWPRLGFVRLGSLDYQVPQYSSAWLAAAAKRLQSQPGDPTYQPHGPIDHAIGSCLAQLAATPAALKKLNEYSERAPQSVRALNVALHYRVRRELDGKGQNKKSRGGVAQAWRMARSGSSVKDANRKYGVAAAKEMTRVIKLCASRPMTRLEVLEALDADLRKRAWLPWFKLPNVKRKAGRRR
jgi:hypothetical protein